MLTTIKRLWKDESAISATEYGILAAVFAASFVTILTIFRGKVQALFTSAGNDVAGAASK